MYLTLNLRHFSLELAQNLRSFDRMNKNRDIEDLVHVDNRREPSLVKKAWVRDYEKAAQNLLTQINFSRCNLECRGGDYIFELQYSGLENLMRQNWRGNRFLPPVSSW